MDGGELFAETVEDIYNSAADAAALKRLPASLGRLLGNIPQIR